jgi:hypothetical protein
MTGIFSGRGAGGALLMPALAIGPLMAGAAPPLGSGYSEPAPLLGTPAAAPQPAAGTPATVAAPDRAARSFEGGGEGGTGADDPMGVRMAAGGAPKDAAASNDAPLQCPPDRPNNLENMVCLSDAHWEIVQTSSGQWEIHAYPDGSYAFVPPPFYDPLVGAWSWNPATDACNPNIEVVLKQAALAGSQITRTISDTQLGYPQTDPIIAVHNPQKDGYGGVCTIDLFAFDAIWKLLGSSYEQIRELIEALRDFSLDDLFGAGCAIVNNLFGDLQNALLRDIRSGLPPSPFEQLARQIRIGFIAPLNTWSSLGLTLKPTTATLPDVSTAAPLLVTHLQDVGYVYLAELSDRRVMVLHIARDPLRPEDAVNPPPI